MKKKLVLVVLAMATLAMAGCRNKNDNDTSRNERTLDILPDIDEAPTATPDATETPEAPIQTETQGADGKADIAAMLNDSAYVGTIEEFTDQFLQYAALCMQYEGSYAGEYLDDTMMRNAIAYTEGLGTTSDCTGVDYSEYGYPCISSDRFAELSDRYFRVEIDNSGLPIMGEETLYDNLLATDEEGNVYVSVGDWGLVGPMGCGVDISYEDNMIVASQSINMYDYEMDEVSYNLGTYTLKLQVNPEDPYDFYIADFTLDYQ